MFFDSIIQVYPERIEGRYRAIRLSITPGSHLCSVHATTVMPRCVLVNNEKKRPGTSREARSKSSPQQKVSKCIRTQQVEYLYFAFTSINRISLVIFGIKLLLHLDAPKGCDRDG